MELERAELAHLLDRALALLPPTMRTVLIERYIQESSLAEVAARLGLSEGAVAKRLERGRLILRRVLTTELSNEAAAYGVVVGDRDGWQETRIWCTTCGDRRFFGRWVQDGNYKELLLKCPVCCPDPDLLSWHVRERYLPGLTFQGIKSFKAALSRVMTWGASYVRPGQRSARCVSCGRAAPIYQDRGEDLPRECGPGGPHIHSYVWCPTCGTGLNAILADRVLNLPEGQRFWREHARIRLLPERELEAAGGPALVTSFESVTRGARLDVVTARDAFEIISIHGAPPL